jgi:streptogramin lyase
MKMRNNQICIGALCLLLAGCGGHQMMSAPTSGNTLGTQGGVNPHVVQNGHVPVQWTQFAWGPTNNTHQFDNLVTGSDNNIWYTDTTGQNLVKMTMAGATHLYPLTYNTNTHYYATGMTVGKDGKFYISNYQNPGLIGVATTTGSFTTKTIPSGDYGYDGSLTLGSDGNVWFTELQHIAKITTAGVVTEYAYPDGDTSNYYGGIASGSDGDIWVTEYNNNVIDDVDTATGNITSYTLPCSPTGLVSAVDGNLWGECSNELVRITTSGSYTVYTNPYSTDGYPSAFRIGPDGNPWFTVGSRNQIGEYNIAANSLVIYFPPSTNGNNYGLTTGPDGNVWAIDSNNKMNVYIIHPLGVTPTSLSMHTGNTATLTVTQKGTTSWTATSSNPGVASVAQGSQAKLFTVTANGLGSTKITIKDAIGNSFSVSVTVS